MDFFRASRLAIIEINNDSIEVLIDMPTLHEMIDAILLIREYCMNESNIDQHEEVLSDLVSRLDADVMSAQEKIQSQYIEAISTLLMLAQPAGSDVLEVTLSQIGTLVGESLTDVQIVGPNGDYLLRNNLPIKRNTSNYEREILTYFKSQLPETILQDSPRRGNDNGPSFSR